MVKTMNTKMQAEMTPEYRNAVSHLLKTVKAHGLEHPLSQAALQVAMELAPDSLIDEMTDMATEMGLLPAPDAYTEAGEPLYARDDLEKALDVASAEFDATVARLDAFRAERGLPPMGGTSGDVHLVH